MNVDQIIQSLRPKLAQIPGINVFLQNPPLIRVGGYREDLMVSEDLDLFLRLAEVGKLGNLPDVLLQYRQHLQSVNYTRYEQQKAVKRQIVAEAYKRRGLPMPANWSFRERKLLPHPEQYRQPRRGRHLQRRCVWERNADGKQQHFQRQLGRIRRQRHL